MQITNADRVQIECVIKTPPHTHIGADQRRSNLGSMGTRDQLGSTGGATHGCVGSYRVVVFGGVCIGRQPYKASACVEALQGLHSPRSVVLRTRRLHLMRHQHQQRGTFEVGSRRVNARSRRVKAGMRHLFKVSRIPDECQLIASPLPTLMG